MAAKIDSDQRQNTMQIVHHIGLRAGEQARAAFQEAGVTLGSGSGSAGIVSFEIAEDDPRWQRVHSLFGKFRVFDTVTTRFSVAEMESAAYLGMVALGHHGYPEPSDDGGFLSATFDLSGYCRVCGVGANQTAPFRLKKAPALGPRSVLQLNWILDEFFVSPEFYTSTFRPLGVGCRPVVLHKTGAVTDSAVQLEIPDAYVVQAGNVPFEICKNCGRTKYGYSLKGPYPKPVDAGGTIFKSSQYFGSGGQAFRLVLVSNTLYRKLREAGIRGVTFYPCRS